jgi:hypothetical protein
MIKRPPRDKNSQRCYIDELDEKNKKEAACQSKPVQSPAPAEAKMYPHMDDSNDLYLEVIGCKYIHTIRVLIGQQLLNNI